MNDTRCKITRWKLGTGTATARSRMFNVIMSSHKMSYESLEVVNQTFQL
jgi:hypothetical protein